MLLRKGSRTYHERKSTFAEKKAKHSIEHLQKGQKKSIRHQHLFKVSHIFVYSMNFFRCWANAQRIYSLFSPLNCVRENFKISRLFPRLSQHGNMLKFKNNFFLLLFSDFCTLFCVLFFNLFVNFFLNFYRWAPLVPCCHTMKMFAVSLCWTNEINNISDLGREILKIHLNLIVFRVPRITEFLINFLRKKYIQIFSSHIISNSI